MLLHEPLALLGLLDLLLSHSDCLLNLLSPLVQLLQLGLILLDVFLSLQIRLVVLQLLDLTLDFGFVFLSLLHQVSLLVLALVVVVLSQSNYFAGDLLRDGFVLGDLFLETLLNVVVELVVLVLVLVAVGDNHAPCLDEFAVFGVDLSDGFEHCRSETESRVD